MRQVLILGIVVFAACPARSETLAEAMRIAYASNPGLLEQRAGVMVLDEHYVQARSGFGPNASATVSGEYQDAHIQQQNILGAESATRNIGRTHTQSLSIVQPLYTSGQISSRVDSAEANVLAARASLAQAEAQLLQMVASAYVDVIRDRDLVKIAEETERAVERENAATKARFAVRAVTRTDLSQAEARLIAAKALVVQARGQLSISQSRYAQTVGHFPEDLTPPPKFPTSSLTLDNAFDLAELYNPVLKQAEYSELASRSAIAEARAALGPSVTGRLDISSNPYLPYNSKLGERSVTAQVIVTQPIFSSGLNQSRVREAIDQNNRDRLDVENQRRSVIQSVSQAWSQSETAKAGVELAKAQVQQEQEAYKGNSIEEGSGLRTTVEVLNALQELQQSRSQLAVLERDDFVANLSLVQAVGILQMKFVDSTVDINDPVAAFNRVAGASTPIWERLGEFLDGFGRSKPVVDRVVRDTAAPQSPSAVDKP